MSPKKQSRYLTAKADAKRAQRVRAAAGRRNRTIGVVIGAVLLIAAAVGVWFYSSSNGQEPPPPNGEQTEEPAEGSQADDEGSPADGEEQQPLPSIDAPQFDAPPPAQDSGDRTWDVTINTNLGPIEMELDGSAAPAAVSNFVFLAQESFFDGTACHRLLPASLLQCGDPTASGGGGPGYRFGPIENAPSDDVYPAGTVAMARVGNDGESMGSQFFLVYSDVTLPSDSAGGYSVFGTITGGLDILEQVGAGGVSTAERPAQDVIIESVEVS